jgi:hypothetical protein
MTWSCISHVVGKTLNDVLRQHWHPAANAEGNFHEDAQPFLQLSLLLLLLLLLLLQQQLLLLLLRHEAMMVC